MARPFTYISSQMYYDLEIYFFRLTLYTDSDEYAELRTRDRNRIDQEILFMDGVLTMMQTFRQRPVTETPVVAWLKEPPGEFNRVFRFSSVTTASRCLGVNTSHIAEICRGAGKSISRKGWVFQYEKDYHKQVDLDAKVVDQKKRESSAIVRSLYKSNYK